MISFDKCLDICNIVLKCTDNRLYDGTTSFGDYSFTFSNSQEGCIKYKNRFLITFFVSTEFYRSTVTILPTEPDPWNPSPYFEINLRESRGTDVIPMFRRYDNTVLDINILDEEVTTDSDVFDSICFQHSLVLNSCDLYAIMLEPFIRKLKTNGSQIRFYERLFEDEIDLGSIQRLLKQRNLREYQ